MWNVDLEDSTGNRANTEDDTDARQVLRISPSGKVAEISQHQVPGNKYWGSRNAYRCRVQ